MKNVSPFHSPEILESKIKYYQSLPEKQRRHFLAMEYLQLGPGSQRYLARVFNCSRQPIVNAVKELQSSGFQIDYRRQREVGGGRKKKRTRLPAST